MGRSVVADDQIWSYCKQFNPLKGYVVGLILGQSSKTCDYVVHLARIPPLSSSKASSPAGGDETLNSKGTADGLSVTDIKEAWVANHACDITRMLPGGMWVLGLFLVGQNDPFENQTNCSRIRSILRHLRSELKKNSCLHGDSPASEKLVLHLNTQKNLVNCRTVDLDGSAAFRQTEWKFQKNQLEWTQIDSILDLHHTWHLDKKDASKQLRNQFQEILNTVCNQIYLSVFLLSNEMQDPEDIVENILKKPKGKSRNQKSSKSDQDTKLLTADLYLPMKGIQAIKASSGVELVNSCGSMFFVGTPLSRVFLHPKATVQEACNAVKQDFVRSLAVRLEMHADSLVEEEPGMPEDSETLHEPPRRVLIKLPSSVVTFSDYLFPGEGPEEALVTCKDLLDLTLELDSVEKDAELPAESGELADWKCEENEDGLKSESTASCGNTSYVFLIALSALLVAIVSFLISIYVSSGQSSATNP